jgi:hypothetical protein
MQVEKPRSTPEQPRTAEVRAFLICDIRGVLDLHQPAR